MGYLRCAEALIHAGTYVDARNEYGETPLADCIRNNKAECAGLLLDAGAKMTNIREGVEIPDWMNNLVNQRRNAKHALKVLFGVLRKRFVVPSPSRHGHIRVPLDMCKMLLLYAWATRNDPKWSLELSKQVGSRKKAESAFSL